MIKHLSLFDFRNISQETFEFSEKNIVFWGDNGRGKTNILEAIALLSVGKSWRDASNEDLIREGQESALIKALTSEEDLYTFSIQKNSKELRKNEKKISIKQHIGSLPSLLFAPEHLTLFSGSKTPRQRFFDRFLCQISPEIKESLSQCKRAIQHKNALYKAFNPFQDNPDTLKNQLAPWNSLLIKTIPAIYSARTHLIQSIAPTLQKEFSGISQTNEPLFIELKSSLEVDLSESVVSHFFVQNTEKEIRAQRCLVGPHLDDYQFFLREKLITKTASRGEERSVLLSLLSAQKQLIQEKLHKSPILLLDDVFSELDQSRQDYLEHLCYRSQIFFTTTHDTHFQNFSHPVQKIYIG